MVVSSFWTDQEVSGWIAAPVDHGATLSIVR
jgi:hypothetical protein